MKYKTCFNIKHLNKHECDVHTSHSKWVFPSGPVAFLFHEQILKGSLQNDLMSFRMNIWIFRSEKIISNPKPKNKRT